MNWWSNRKMLSPVMNPHLSSVFSLGRLPWHLKETFTRTTEYRSISTCAADWLREWSVRWPCHLHSRMKRYHTESRKNKTTKGQEQQRKDGLRRNVWRNFGERRVKARLELLNVYAEVIYKRRDKFLPFFLSRRNLRLAEWCKVYQEVSTQWKGIQGEDKRENDFLEGEVLGKTREKKESAPSLEGFRTIIS